MNGRGQLYMNIGITLVLGFYSICGAIYSEAIKPDYERNWTFLALNIFFALTVLTWAVAALFKAYSLSRDDRVSDQR